MNRVKFPQPTGLQEYFGERYGQIERVRNHLLDHFFRAGFQPVDPPILENADFFLEHHGETVRQNMFIFDDPEGEELCLRPGLTIASALLYLRYLNIASHTTRIAYAGPAFNKNFRHPKGRYRQSTQVGVECFRGQNPEAVDAEIIGLAWRSAISLGLEPRLVLGDLTLFFSLIDQLDLPNRWKKPLKRHILDQEYSNRVLKTLQASAGAKRTGQQEEELFKVLMDLGPEQARTVLESVLSMADVRLVGSRGIGDVISRLIDEQARRAEPVSEEQMEIVRRFLEIGGPVPKWTEQVTAFARDVGVDLSQGLARMEKRLSLLRLQGLPVERSTIANTFNRDINFYTGMMFELHVLGQAKAVCGGGRYDELLAALGASEEIPAVGFNFHLDELVEALEPVAGREEPGAPALLVVPISENEIPRAIELARLLREGGYNAGLEFPQGTLGGNALGKIIRNSPKHGVTHILFIGEQEVAKGVCRIKDLDRREESVLAPDTLLEHLSAYQGPVDVQER